MDEWFKSHAWKACLGVSLTGVRIPPSPPEWKENRLYRRFFFAYSQLAAEARTTLVVPSNMTEVSALITSAMKMVQAGQNGTDTPPVR